MGLVVKNLPVSVGIARDVGSVSGSGRSLAPPPLFLPGEFHGQMSLSSYSPWAHRVRHN